MPGIFLIDESGELVPLGEKEYDSEAMLQELLAKHPDLLAGDQVNPIAPRQWLFVAREAGIPDREGGSGRWSLDHLFLDQDAIPTFVEVKQSSNTEIRRQVVGQMLDYAANALKYWPVEFIQSCLAETAAAEGMGVEEALRGSFGEDVDSEEYWAQVRQNLEEGRLRLLFVADQIPSELEAIVEFLNRQMDHTEVLAIEIRQFVGQGLKTLVPRVLGQTIEARQKKDPVTRGRKWDEERFFGALAENTSPEGVAAVRQLYEWARDTCDYVQWGEGKVTGSFQGRFRLGEHIYYPIVCYSSAAIEFEFSRMDTMPPFDDLERRFELFDKFAELAGFDYPRTEDTVTRRYPWVAIADMVRAGQMVDLIEVLEWFRAEAETAAQ